LGQVALLGDLDGDGVPDLLVTQAHDDDAGYEHGAVWVIFLPEPSAGAMLAAGLFGLLVLAGVKSARVRRRSR
jgi:hypothetical protein